MNGRRRRLAVSRASGHVRSSAVIVLDSPHITSKRLLGAFAPSDRLRFSLCLFVAAWTTEIFCCVAFAAADRGWEYRPYQIRVILAIDVPGGLSAQLAVELPRYLERRAFAAVGPVWSLEAELATGAMRRRVLSEAIDSADIEPAEFPFDGDKLLLLAVKWRPDGFELAAREFDRYVERWGAPLRRHSRQAESVAEQLFQLVCQAVAPLAQFELDPQDPQRVVLVPRGGALLNDKSAASWAGPGDVFQPILRRTARGGELVKGGIQRVPWTYLEVIKNDGEKVLARIQSGGRRPFGARRQGRTEQVAIAVRSDPAETIVRLHSRSATKKPLIGYEVFTRSESGKSVSRIGATDRDGKLATPPAKDRVRVLYIKNGAQLLARLPVVPGAEPQIDVPLPDDEPRLAAEARLAALREDLIDVVARRNILMARAQQKIEQKDFAAAQKLLTAIDQLPGRAQFNLTLTTAARSTRSDDPQIQRRIDRLFEATQTVLTQFLDVRPISKLHDELRAAQSKGT